MVWSSPSAVLFLLLHRVVRADDPPVRLLVRHPDRVLVVPCRPDASGSENGRLADEDRKVTVPVDVERRGQTLVQGWHGEVRTVGIVYLAVARHHAPEANRDHRVRD